MDYGKLAYLKAEDLEGRVKAIDFRARSHRKFEKLGVSLAKDKIQNLTDINVESWAGIIVSVVLEKSSTSTTSLARLLIDGLVTVELPITQSLTFITSLENKGVHNISFSASEAVTIRNYQVMAIGEASFNYASANTEVFAAGDGAFALANQKNATDCEILFSTNISTLASSTVKALIFGSVNALEFVYIDGEQYLAAIIKTERGKSLLHFLKLNDDGKLIIASSIVLESGIEGEALASYGDNRLCIGYIKGGSAYAQMINLNDFSKGDASWIDNADRVLIVRNAELPAAVYSKNGTNYLRLSDKEEICPIADSITLTCS